MVNAGMSHLEKNTSSSLHHNVTFTECLHVCCQVLVIDKGHIVERGTHKDLLAINGVYKKLVLRQLSTSQGTAETVDGFNPDLLEPGEPPIVEVDES